jgi:hypothetical protein
MGQEAECRVESPAGVGVAKVLLETDSVIVRGGVKETIPFKAISQVAVDGGKLILTHGGGQTKLFLGARSAHWAQKILNPKSRLEKLGVKAEMRISVVGVKDPDFKSELKAARADFSWGRLRSDSAIAFLGVEKDLELRKLPAALEAIRQDGAIWVIHPKGRAGVKDTTVFGAGKKLGLVANKVAKFSETHTGERLVIPLAQRRKS